jgi:Fe-S oxidoreductase
MIRRQKNPPTIKLYEDKRQEARIWEIRESGLGATAYIPGEPDTWEGWEDSAVAPEKVGPYLRDLRRLFDEFGYDGALYGHFGQGCIHTRINFDLLTAAGIAKYRAFAERAADLVLSYGGSLSGEHGDGQSRGELLEKMYGPELMQTFREFKSIWDPQWKMNPGKVIDANPLDSHLTLGTTYAPPPVSTHFHYPEDHGTFGHVALRCVGVGNCRRTEGGTMCPSYMVTLEEKHSTRGRSRMLYEMMRGEVIDDGWQSEEVKDALDLCLACKGCKGECPVNVDMATYKSEFLSHYYEQHRRPRSAYAMGLVYWWTRIASLVPNFVNAVGHAPGLGRVVKWMGGIAPERDLPPFASESFKTWFFRRGERNVGGPDVILWPDTFNNYFHPQVARAAVEVLEAGGFHVVVPSVSLCCGRPLYDYGFLDRAKIQLRQILDALRPQIRAGVPLVGLEPSCLAVFRDEMTNILPQDYDAKRLKAQAFTLGEFLNRREGYQAPRLDGRAIVHGHCHHKAIMGLRDDEVLLGRMGLDYKVLDSGCCGMAGSFGFEQQHYDISAACGERVLLPAVRQAPAETLIVADGFSCQEQIRNLTDRRALHLAEVMQMALHTGRQDGPDRAAMTRREQQAPAVRRSKRLTRTESALAIGAASLLVGGLVAWQHSRRS